MKNFACFTTLLIATTTAHTAQAQVFDQDTFLALLESDHSPLLAPLSFESADQVGDRMTLSGVDFGWFSLDKLAFDVRAVAGDQVRLDNFSFPTAEDLRANMPPEDQLVWEVPTLSIVYNMKDEAPDQIEFTVAPIEVVSAIDGFDFAFEGLSLSMTADKDTGGASLDFQSGSGHLAVADGLDDFRLSLPSLSLSGSESEYPEGVHPFVGLRTQIKVQSAQHKADGGPTQMFSDLATALNDLVLPNASDFDLQISGFEFHVPSEDFTFTAGPTEFRGESNDSRNPGQGRSFSSWVTNDLKFSFAGGGEVSIGELFFEGNGEQEDRLRLMSAFSSPAFVSFGSVLEEAISTPVSRPESALREFLLQPDLSTGIEDVFIGLGKQEFSFGLSDAFLNFSVFQMSLGELIIESRFDLTATDQAETEFALKYAALDAPLLALMSPNLYELLPTDMRLDLDVSKIDLANLVDRFAGLADGDLAPDVDAMIQVGDMIAVWWQSAGAVFTPQVQVDSQATRITLEGDFPFDSEAAFGLTGDADVTISNFSQLKALTSSLLDNPGPGIADYASGATTALEALDQLGDIDSKDTLTLDVKLDSSGTITVNNLPFPN